MLWAKLPTTKTGTTRDKNKQASFMERSSHFRLDPPAPQFADVRKSRARRTRTRLHLDCGKQVLASRSPARRRNTPLQPASRLGETWPSARPGNAHRQKYFVGHRSASLLPASRLSPA